MTLATLPLTLGRISFPDAEPAPALDVGTIPRTSGEVSFRWFAAIDDEPVARTIERLRLVVPELDGLGLERIGTSPGGVLVLRWGEVRAPILEPTLHEVIAALDVILSHAGLVFRFVPVRTEGDVLYAAVGAEEAVELLHGGMLGFTDLTDLLDYASF